MQTESDAHRQLKRINELGRLCVSMNLNEKNIYQAFQTDRQCMYSEIQYLLDHRLSIQDLENAYRMKGLMR